MRIAKKLSAMLLMVAASLSTAVTAFATNSGTTSGNTGNGGIANSIAATGTQNLINDVTSWAMVLVKGFSVLNSSNGIFVAMPQEKGNDGNYYDKAFPITADARKIIQQAVIEAYSARVKAREQAAEQDGEQFTASTPDESAEEQSTEDEEEMELA